MARSNNGDLFEFVITPNFDREGVVDSANLLEDELKRISERIAEQIKNKLGSAVDLSGVDTSNINDITKLVAQLGGQVTRTGTAISATFKDASGDIVKVTDNVKDAIDLIQQYYSNLKSNGIKTSSGINVNEALSNIEEFRNTSMTYSGEDEIKNQQELENKIIQNLQQRYQYELKIRDAERDGNSIKKQYYEDLKSILGIETNRYKQELARVNNGSDETARIKQTEKALSDKEKAYERLTSRQKTQQQQEEQQNKAQQDAINLLKQYYIVSSNISKLEQNGQTNGNYWSEQKQELTAVTNELSKYGIAVDQATGKLNFNQQSQQAQQLGQNVEKVNNAIKQGNTAIDQRNAKMADQKPIQTIKDYEQALKQARELESNNKQGTKAYQDTQAAIQKLEAELAKYGIQVKTASDGTKTLESTQQNATTSTDQFKEALNDFNVKQESANNGSKGLSGSIEESVQNFIKYQVALEAVNKLVSEFVSAVSEMDSAMTQVRMVTMDSYEDTVKLSQQYGELAQKLGATVTTVAEGADAWLRQGYNSKDAMTMLEASSTLAVVGQMDAAEATDQLTAITKSYNTSVEETMNIVDKLVAVDLEYAASSSEISTALQKVASSAGQAGLGLDKLIGLITISEEKTRQSAEVIGSAWQSIVSR